MGSEEQEHRSADGPLGIHDIRRYIAVIHQKGPIRQKLGNEYPGGAPNRSRMPCFVIREIVFFTKLAHECGMNACQLLLIEVRVILRN